MKVRIAYQAGEEKQAQTLFELVRGFLNGPRVRTSDKHPPYRHIYISTTPPRETGED